VSVGNAGFQLLENIYGGEVSGVDVDVELGSIFEARMNGSDHAAPCDVHFGVHCET
jgi:hypothetical protein